MQIFITCKNDIASVNQARQNFLQEITEYYANQLKLTYLSSTELLKYKLADNRLELCVSNYNTKPGYQLDLHAFINKEHFNLGLDFVNSKFVYQAQHAKQKNLIKAVKTKTGQNNHILDACAGFARDSFALAAAGFKVTMLEQNPVIAAITSNAIQRGQQANTIQTINSSLYTKISEICNRLTIIQADAIQLMQEICKQQRIDSIYLDPMFPNKNSKAKVKKESRFLRLLANAEENNLNYLILLRHALDCPVARVILKRPKYAAITSDPKPSGCLHGKTTRYEIFA